MVIHKVFTSYTDLADWIDRLREQKVGVEIEGTEEFVYRLFQRTQDLCPYLSGLLQSTGRVIKTGATTWLIVYGDPGVGCDYARHVYYGHFAGETWVPGRPWIEWAIQEMIGEWSQIQVMNLGRIN